MSSSDRRRQLRAGAGLLGLVLLGVVGAVDGCGHSGGRPALPPSGSIPLPPWLQPPVAPAAATSAAAPVAALPATVADPGRALFDPEAIVAVLDEPRLADVKAAAGREAYLQAADLLERRLALAPPEPPVESRWQYQLGMLRMAAGQPGAAVRAFDRAAAADWPLADYARLLGGDLLVQIDEPAEGLARLDATEAGGAYDDEIALARARALSALRRVDEASAIWRAYLAARPRPRDWQLVALRWGNALLNAPSLAHAEQAVEVARMVIYESPMGRGVGEARAIEQQALSTIPAADRSRFLKPAEAELVARARALGEAQQGREAIAAADQLREALRASGAAVGPSEAACEAYLARSKGLGALRRYAEASEAAETAIDRCQGQLRHVVALFVGGRYALRGGQPGVARTRFAELERLYPRDALADDARLHGAEVARELGDLAAFTRMLSDIDEAYPEGDMVDQALFTLARDRIEAGDWAGAVAPLERAVRRQHRGRPYWAEGRPQYFLGRARIELGQQAEGVELLARVIRDFPLSYFMLLAHSRLSSLDGALAARVLGDALAAEPQGDFVIPDHPELHRPAFLRAVELVRQGDGQRALAELESLGVRGEQADPSLLWASAFLLARIDAATEPHELLRNATDVWSEHYPAGIWRPVWELAFPRPFLGIVTREAKRAAIPEHLAYAVMREESAFRPRASSSAGAHGLMQLIVPTAQQVARDLGLSATAETLKRPAVNIALGCKFLGMLTRKFPFNPLLAIPGYNAGPGAPQRWVAARPTQDFDVWVEAIPYRETREYTKRVIRSMAAYAVLYGNGLGADLVGLPLGVKPDG